MDLSKLKWHSKPQNEQDIIQMLSEIDIKGYYPSCDFNDLSTEVKMKIESGLALISDGGGSFSDVFFVGNTCIKVHTRFEFDFMISLERLGIIDNDDDALMLLLSDYEVLRDIEDSRFTPMLHGIYSFDMYDVSLVEKIDGKSIMEKAENGEVLPDAGFYESFLTDFFNHSISKGWIPLDVNNENVFIDSNGNFKVIDFSLFQNESALEENDSLMPDTKEALLSCLEGGQYYKNIIKKALDMYLKALDTVKK